MSTSSDGRADRILAEAVAGLLPDGLVAVPVRPADLEPVTELMRAAELAACDGHSATNAAEVCNDLAGPDCDWERGAAMVRREDADATLVGVLVLFDLLADGRWVDVDPYVRPDDPQSRELAHQLVAAGLAEGRTRWAALADGAPAPGSVEESTAPGSGSAPLAKGGCYAADAITREAFEANGFAEVRRFWRMQIDHPATAVGAAPHASQVTAHLPGGYRMRPFRAEDPAEWQAMFEVGQRSFADHFDFTPSRYDTWRAHVTGTTDDVTQWVVVERDGGDGELVAFARGSDRYASEGAGYVATLGVLREHRGRGLAKALLGARFIDDARRRRASTLLHVDAENPTGATALYESVGMRVEQEIVAFHRPLLDG